MTPLVDQRLRDALAAADLVHGTVVGQTFDDYLGDVWLRSGVERQLEIIGEALNVARRLAPELANKFPTIHEWIALRHIIVHAYDRASFLKSNLILVGVGLSIDHSLYPDREAGI